MNFGSNHGNQVIETRPGVRGREGVQDALGIGKNCGTSKGGAFE